MTSRFTSLVWVRPPPIPVIVSALLPGFVDRLIVTVKVELPLAGLGVKLALAPTGSPLTLRVTRLVKPLPGVIVTV